MIKEKRHEEIIKLITNNDIGTQEDLTAKLIKKGFDVSQSTVSRDIKELNLIKIESTNGYKYIKAKIDEKIISPQIINLFKQITLSIDIANNLIVIKTLSGNASAAGMAIDEMKLPQVLGTIAGDDTLLIVAKTSTEAEIILKSLRNI